MNGLSALINPVKPPEWSAPSRVHLISVDAPRVINVQQAPKKRRRARGYGKIQKELDRLLPTLPDGFGIAEARQLLRDNGIKHGRCALSQYLQRAHKSGLYTRTNKNKIAYLYWRAK